jgi:hypothetical protein
VPQSEPMLLGPNWLSRPGLRRWKVTSEKAGRHPLAEEERRAALVNVKTFGSASVPVTYVLRRPRAASVVYSIVKTPPRASTAAPAASRISAFSSAGSRVRPPVVTSRSSHSSPV